MSEIENLGLRVAGDDPAFEWLLKDLAKAFLAARKGKLKTPDEVTFELNLAQNLHQLAEDIYYQTYCPTAGIAFVSKPINGVAREIYAAPFRDRIVHHYICGYVMDWWDRRLDYDSASCRKGKGTLFALDRMQKHFREVSDNYKYEIYVYKCDLKGFFMSLSREKLLKRALEGLNRQFDGHFDTAQYRHLRFLWQQVLLNDPTKTVHYRGSKSDWDLLPSSKILSRQPEGHGIVIGNLTSQLASNFYLDLLDRRVRELMREYIKYGRYVDDFYFVVRASDWARFMRDFAAVKFYVEEILQLTLHPNKCKLYKNINQGIPFLGWVVAPHRRVAGKRLKDNYFRTAMLFLDGLASVESMRAYEGLLLNGNGRKLVDEIYETFHLDPQYQLKRSNKWEKKLRKG